MMLDDLPDNVLERILDMVPQYILFQLLKSKTMARIAWNIYYNQIIIDESEITELPAKIKTNYRELSTAIWKIPGDELYVLRAYPSFPSPESIVAYSKRNPFFQPRILRYQTVQQLEAIHKADPGFLSRFKLFTRAGKSAEDFVPSFDFNSLPHDLYSLDCDTSGLFPTNVKKLESYRGNGVTHLMPTVESFEVSSPRGRTDLKLHFLPNLTQLSIGQAPFGDSFSYDLPRLKRLSIQTRSDYRFDLSRYDNLRQLSISDISTQTIGIDVSNDIVLPINVEYLSLSEIYYNFQWEDFGKLVNVSNLAVMFGLRSGYTLEGFELPPNVKEVMMGNAERLDWEKDIRVPKTLESIRFTGTQGGFDISEFPRNAEVDVLDARGCRIFYPATVTMKKRLRTLVCKIEKNRYDKRFPKSLQYLDLTDNDGISDLSGLKELTTLKQHVLPTMRFPVMKLPPNVTDLTWINVETERVVNYENLVTLHLNNCESNLDFSKLHKLEHLYIQSNATLSLENLPDTLRYLMLFETVIKPTTLYCPKNLKYLEIKKAMIGNLKINRVLEVLYLSYTEFDLTPVLKDAGPNLTAIALDNCDSPALEADLSHTKLEFFWMITDEYDRDLIKFPDTLMTYDVTDGVEYTHEYCDADCDGSCGEC